MRICFTSEVVLPFFDPVVPMRHVGGAELQQYYLGKDLAERGLEVVYLSHDFSQDDWYEINGVSFAKTFSPAEGLPGLRFFYPRLSGIWKALHRANADVYYIRCADFKAGVLAMYCKRYDKKFVFAGAHDSDFMPGRQMLNLRDRKLFEYGLKRANAVIVQSKTQRELLKKNYGLDGILIRNIYPPETVSSKNSRSLILWVATMRSWKRPELFVEAAKYLPDERLVMIGGPGKDRKFYERVEKLTREAPNLDFKGYMPFNETKKFFDQAKLFVNTSEIEGFPNTFLQAWCRGIPVVSFLDPDGVIQENGLGVVVSTKREFIRAIRETASNSSAYSGAVTAYYRKNHSLGAVQTYIDLFDNLISA